MVAFLLRCHCVWLLASLFAMKSYAAVQSIEVSHWWTSGSEANAIDVLKQEVIQHSYDWKDSGSIVGGGGALQRRVLQARLDKGTPPDAILLQGNSLENYAKSSLISSLESYAHQQKWQEFFPKPLQSVAMYQGQWMAVPVNIHRTNWVWANKAIFDELHLLPPKTFKELLDISTQIKQAGYIPFAHGGEPWQDILLFDATVLATGGMDFYRKALIDFKPDALDGKIMVSVFDRLRQLTQFFDPNWIGRDWNLATAMVIHKKAAMQVMGDWVRGEFHKAGKLPNKDFLCFEYPQTQGNFVFVTDVFGMLKVPKAQKVAQDVLVEIMIEKGFQERFNLAKGSIPARMDVSMEHFDDCAKKAHTDFQSALKVNKVVRNFDTVVTDKQRAVFYRIISNFLNHPNVSSLSAAKELRACLKEPIQASCL